MKKAIILSYIFFFFNSGSLVFGQQIPTEDFNFVFMTDIHLEPGRGAPDGFKMAIDTANKLNADFVLTGGDLIMDALKASHGKADSLYTLYAESIKEFEMPVYNTIGNHELFGLQDTADIYKTHPDYNDGMFRRYFGDSYYSFDHKGWHFIVLKSITDEGDYSYYGNIDDEQMEWLKQDIAKLDTLTPIIISTHIPFITTYGQLRNGSLAPNDSGLVVDNSQEVLMMLHNYNVKLILQGHLHIVEYIHYHTGLDFLVGGAISACWWKGPNKGMEEGFMNIKLCDGEVDWEYIDYGWEAWQCE